MTKQEKQIAKMLRELKAFLSANGVDVDFRTDCYLDNSYGLTPCFSYQKAEKIMPIVYEFFINEKLDGESIWQYNTQMQIEKLKTQTLKSLCESLAFDVVNQKEHGNTGNKNALKEVKKEAFIKLMCEPEFKSLVVSLAQKHGYKNMTELCMTAIKQFVEYELKHELK